MYQNIFDSHAHYDDERFNGDCFKLLDELFAQGLGGVINAAISIESAKASLTLAQRYPQLYCAAGIHPDTAFSFTDADLTALLELSREPKVIAIGEIGLDYYYDDATPREMQKIVFEKQIILANELNLPVIIHDRDAHQDTLDILRRHRPKGVLHCYSGSAEMAKEITALGLYLGFTGVVTFKNARKALEAVQAVPLNRLLIETDCPYMAPEPNRGKRCDSGMLTFTGEKLAELKGITPQELFNATSYNAHELFSI